MRNITVPCAGTVAVSVPAVSRVVCAHRSRTRYAGAAGMPIALAEVVIRCGASDSLNSATALSPPASGLTKTSRPPSVEIGVGAEPVLVDGDDLFVGEDAHRRGRGLAQVA